MQVIKLFFIALLFISGRVASARKLRGVMSLAARRQTKSLKATKDQEHDVIYVLPLSGIEQQEFTYMVVSPMKANKNKKLCSAHGACAALVGSCCPTMDNVMLDCCYSEESDDKVPALVVIDQEDNSVVAVASVEQQENAVVAMEPQEDTDMVVVAVSPADCSVNSECAALGLTGMCCPTNDNVTFDCCA
jgi:hypothetical protein